MGTTQDLILRHIRSRGRGRVFIPKDFLDEASRDATDQALSRLVRAGDLRRVGRGLYYYPRVNPKLGIPIAPDVDEVADALGRQTGSRVIPSGAVAANRLGFSAHVPAKFVYLTDGRSREVQLDRLTIRLKHVAPRELPAGNRTSAFVFQALRHLGNGAVDEQVIATLRRALSPEQRRELRRDARYTTGWIADHARRVAAPAPREPVGAARG